MHDISSEGAKKDVSTGVTVRVRRHLASAWLMGAGVFLFIAGMVASSGGAVEGIGTTLVVIGEALFLTAIAYGLISTFVNLRCPACGTFFGFVVSALYAPIGVSDDYAPVCRGCGAKLLRPSARARARSQFRMAIAGMVLLPFAATAAGFVLR